MRTPLNGIIGINQLLQRTSLDVEQKPNPNPNPNPDPNWRTSLDVEQKELCALISSSGDNLLRVINDILDLTRVESGKLELDLCTFDLSETVDAALDSIIIPATEKGLELILFIQPNCPMIVIGDSGRLKQIVLNLLSNAIKFTRSGEVYLSVEVEEQSESRITYIFKVTDTGIGIPTEAQEKLFSRFTQVDTSTTRNYGGTGLGLAISKQLAELMGGQMGLESEDGQGSTFWFTSVMKVEDENMQKVYPSITS